MLQNVHMHPKLTPYEGSRVYSEGKQERGGVAHPSSVGGERCQWRVGRREWESGSCSSLISRRREVPVESRAERVGEWELLIPHQSEARGASGE
jgi:hypothetical protein